MRTLLLCVVLSLAAPPVVGCHPKPETAAALEHSATIAFGAALGALEVLDDAQWRRMRSDPEPTLQKAAQEKDLQLRLERLRLTLVVARKWLSGDGTEKDGRQALRDAAAQLQLVMDELRSRSIQIPSAVDTALIAIQAMR